MNRSKNDHRLSGGGVMTSPIAARWGPARALEHALAVGSYSHVRRFHGGTCAIFTGADFSGHLASGELLVSFLTDIGSFFAVGPNASRYDQHLVGRFIFFDWLWERGSRITRDVPIILTAPPPHPKPAHLTWTQHLAAERALAQREEFNQPGNEDAIRAQRFSKCPLCGWTVNVGDPILECFEGWAHARCATKHKRNPICPLCQRPVRLHQEPHHQLRGDAHMACVVGPRPDRLERPWRFADKP
jgi:hypothetical protein